MTNSDHHTAACAKGCT